MSALPEFAPGLTALADRFEALLLDQFGVLHDGERPYPSVLEAMGALKDRGKRLLVLSNSGKRAAPNEARLERLGIPRRLFDGLVSSGEVAWQALRGGELEPFAGLGRALVFTRGGDRSITDGLDLEIVDDPDDAQFVLMAGSDLPDTLKQVYHEKLARAAKRGLPMLCCNPDLVMLTSHGPQPGAGSFAQSYAEAGGEVTWVGKPHGLIYEHALRLLNDVPVERVWACGDSLHHDVKGAAAAGLRSILIAGGEHGVSAGLGEEELAKLTEEAKVWPDAIVRAFVP